jgi:hypothetical protein
MTDIPVLHFTSRPCLHPQTSPSLYYIGGCSPFDGICIASSQESKRRAGQIDLPQGNDRILEFMPLESP